MLYLGKDDTSMVHVTIFRKSTESDDTACREAMSDKTGASHVGLDLLELGHSSA